MFAEEAPAPLAAAGRALPLLPVRRPHHPPRRLRRDRWCLLPPDPPLALRLPAPPPNAARSEAPRSPAYVLRQRRVRPPAPQASAPSPLRSDEVFPGLYRTDSASGRHGVSD